MDRLAVKKPRRPGFFPWLKEQLKDYPPFLRDTVLVGGRDHPNTYRGFL